MPSSPASLTLWLTSWVFFLTPSAAVSIGGIAPVVNVGHTQYQGYYDTQTNTTSFLSIRYAAPPVGKLRFQAPQPPPHEPGVQLAIQNPNMCHQAGLGTNPNLTLPDITFGYDIQPRLCNATANNVDVLPRIRDDSVFIPGTIPADPAITDGLPVLVWIHGGGYTYGYAGQYDGASLIVDSLNTVVVVVIQYRLGAFGFLAGHEVKIHGALNAGLLDQAFALRWVQNHIGKFGGDKARVTIWGESAGAGSVLQHIVAHGGNTQPSLFNAAIVSSLALAFQYHYDDQAPQSSYNKVVAMTGCGSSTDTFKCLQSVDVETLQIANNNLSLSAFFSEVAFFPIVDGTFILERPTITLSKGQVNGQVLLAVCNEDEGAVFANANNTPTINDYVSHLFPKMTSLELEGAAEVYQDYGSVPQQAVMAVGESIFVCPTYYLLEAFRGRSWKGLFAIPPAYHGDDIPYYFHSPTKPPLYNNSEFITAFSESFMSLVRYEDVNVKFDSGDIAPYWDTHSVGITEMLFNRTESGAPVVSPIRTDLALLRRCAFWSSVTSSTGQ